MNEKYKAVQCNIPNSTALVNEYARCGFELVSVVKEIDLIYVYWFKNNTNN